ncbi:UPF0488 protein C8orf33 homolog isoform X1 [Xyrichtys novacula]|uniref:UPF0488 protein C8orf33 homolog isoform X1 n=1 Tax=Xyrichtys novacula TaxID=13765 RepID=A0AAV1H5Z3_XYRNO|nr:UPF0488 protein C8orf33 homolog isoform X1 [Xyrichtys novacula]
MTEPRLLFIDIEPKSNNSAPVEGRSEKPLWTRTDNTFRFNFLPDSYTSHQEETSPSSSSEPAASHISFTGQGSAFAFNFKIPSDTPVESMETLETLGASLPDSQQDKSLSLQEVSSPSESSGHSKAKKKKNRKKNPSNSSETQQKSSPEEGSKEGEDTELSAEEQLNRQLDWCIEQLELGMKSQKGTPKQKEEASRALKTLRSSKAPLVKKRQVMRAMIGDYRKKMEEEKSKQYKLIQSEIASAGVKVVPEPTKRSVFHRKAEVKAKDTDVKAQSEEQMSSAFVFTPSKEEFHFNFF